MKKSLTLAAYRRGKGARREREALAQAVAQALERAGQDAKIIVNGAQALAQATGANIAPDDDLQALVELVRDDPKASPVLALLTAARAPLLAARKALDAPRKLSAMHGAGGGKKAAAGNKKPNGLTSVQARRAARFDALLSRGMVDAEALDAMCAEEGCTPQAMRQSLRKAGRTVSTKARQGVRRR
jgi:hypothetical protein